MIARITDAFSTVLIAFADVFAADSTPDIAVIVNAPILPIKEIISPAGPPIVFPSSSIVSASSDICALTSFSAFLTWLSFLTTLSFAAL